jgi:hypothetical protein
MTSGKKPRGLRKRAATGAPLTDAELREFGNALRPFARELSALCRQFLADEFEDIGHVFALMVHSPEDMEEFRRRLDARRLDLATQGGAPGTRRRGDAFTVSLVLLES